MKDIIVYKLDGTILNSIAQWDRDVYICVKESNITSPYKLHFFNSESELAYVVESTYDGGTLIAKIPNVLVMQPFEIIGYVYDENASGGGQSLVRFSINVVPRPMPSDAIYPGTVDYLSYAEIMENCRDFTISESNRVVAEQNRVTAENARVAAETERANAEAERKTAESARKTNETTRINSESARIQAEQNRVTAENARVAAETERANAEQNRVAAWANALGIKEITIQDLDNNKQYIYQYVIQDGHLGIVLTEASATVEETS